MPLTDTKVRALFGKAQKGEKVGKEADGGGLNLIGGKCWLCPIVLPESRRLLTLVSFPSSQQSSFLWEIQKSNNFYENMNNSAVIRSFL